MAGERHFGKYEVLEEVGQGGMSVVYRGRDTVLGREVAIKVMHPFMASRSEAKERFYREARTVARLHHPNVLEIYDFSAQGEGDAYIVTEFIRGETLAGLVRRAKIALPEIGLLIVRTLLSALQHAHEEGVIHRDLKPENVMIDKNGVVKLMDFGIAQMLDADTLTTTGALLGSPAHMAPELIEGEACDARSDLFSIGTILYWLVCGRLPFTAPTAPALFKRIVDGEFDDPRLHNPQISPGVLAILRRFLRKQREERYPTARAAAAELDKELQASGVERPDEWLRDFFADPEETQARLGVVIADRMRIVGDQALAKGEVGLALQAFDRRLALVPEDHALRQQVLQLSRRLRRREQVQRVVHVTRLTLVLIALWGAAVWAARVYLHQGVEEGPALHSPAPLPIFQRAKVEPTPRERESSLASERPVVSPAGPPREVEFRVFPFGTLSIDGKVIVEDAQRPVKISLVPGHHRLRADNPYREPVERDLEIAATGSLEPVAVRLDVFRPGRLVVHSDPGADVVVDGEVKGPAIASEREAFKIPLLHGERSVEVKVVKPGKPDKNEHVLVRAGETVELNVRW